MTQASGDAGIDAFAQSVELAVGDAARNSAASGPNAKLVGRFRTLIRNAPDESAALEVALGLENQAASTYLFVLGSLEAPEALQLAASILPVESEHAVALAELLGKDPREKFPTFETQDQALKPDQ